MMIMFWKRIAREIGFQKMYVCFGLNHHLLEKMCDGQTDRKWKIEQYSGKGTSHKKLLVIF